jgi:hypothetical protein
MVLHPWGYIFSRSYRCMFWFSLLVWSLHWLNLVYLRDRYWGHSCLTTVLMMFWVYLRTTLMW